MSLINDALKRARQAQAQAPPSAPGPAFRPVEPSQQTNRGRGWILTALGVVLAISALLAFWYSFRTNRSLKAAVSKPMAVVPIAVVSRAPTNPTPPAIIANQTPSPPPLAITAPVSETISAAPAASNINITVAAAQQKAPGAEAGPVINAAAAAPAVATGKPEPIKLQGIMFHPAHPAALIGGKALFVGDKLGDWRVAAIGHESATLISAAQTNVLTLPQQ